VGVNKQSLGRESLLGPGRGEGIPPDIREREGILVPAAARSSGIWKLAGGKRNARRPRSGA
jgi:hypothetical protein